VDPDDGTVEAIQFVNAELVAEGVYDLSMLLRGRFGTEQNASGHAAGHEVVLLDSAGKAKLTSGTGDLGSARYYKAVTIGRAADTVDSEEFTDNGVALKPYAVVDVRKADNGDGTFDLSWRRRTRLATRFLGPLSSSVPLGEESESYKVRVYNGSGVLQSTQTVSTNAATVTASSGWYAVINQMSASVGEGYPTEITL
jgi:hypothetical protein